MATTDATTETAIIDNKFVQGMLAGAMGAFFISFVIFGIMIQTGKMD